MTIKDDVLKICRTHYDVVETPHHTISPNQLKRAQKRRQNGIFGLVACSFIGGAAALWLAVTWVGHFSQANGMAWYKILDAHIDISTMFFGFIILTMAISSIPASVTYKQAATVLQMYRKQNSRGTIDEQMSSQEAFEQAKKFITTHTRSMMVADMVALKNSPGVQEWAKVFLHHEIIRKFAANVSDYTSIQKDINASKNNSEVTAPTSTNDWLELIKKPAPSWRAGLNTIEKKLTSAKEEQKQYANSTKILFVIAILFPSLIHLNSIFHFLGTNILGAFILFLLDMGASLSPWFFIIGCICLIRCSIDVKQKETEKKKYTEKHHLEMVQSEKIEYDFERMKITVAHHIRPLSELCILKILKTKGIQPWAENILRKELDQRATEPAVVGCALETSEQL